MHKAEVSATDAMLLDDGARSTVIVFILAIGAFMQMLDSSILATAIPQMAIYFHVSPTALGIGITSYILASVIVLPSSGWLADHIGARKLLVLALLGFTISSVLCGMSRTIVEFVASRVLQGITGAFLGPVGSMIMMQTVRRDSLVRMVNVFSTSILIAPVLGPPIGGILTTMFGWQWIFYLNVPAGLIGILLALLYVPEIARARRAFDATGFVLNGGAIGLIVFGVGGLGEEGSARLVGALCLVLGACVAPLAVAHALRHKSPLLSLAPMAVPTFRLTGMLAMPLLRLPLAALPFAIPIMLQAGFGMSAFMSGMLFIAHTSGDLVVKLHISVAFKRFGFRRVMIVCTILLAATVFTTAFFDVTTPVVVMAVILFAAGVVRSFINSGTGTLSYADIPPTAMASATTLSLVIMQVVQAISVSITAFMINAAMALRGSGPITVTAGDCKAALIVMAGLCLFALWPLLCLDSDAGAALTGHRRKEASL